MELCRNCGAYWACEHRRAESQGDWAVNVEQGKITVGGKTASVPTSVATDAAHALDSQG